MPLYAAFLDLDGCAALVVGGGRVGARKARGLLEAGASVRAVAPAFRQQFEALETEFPGRLARAPRAFEPSDLDGVRLVVSATDDPATNARVARLARDRGVWLNDAEDPDRGDLRLGAVHRDGDAVLAVSTGGASPRLAARLRDRLLGRWPAGLGARLAVVAAERRQAVALAEPARSERLAALEARLDAELFGAGAA